MNRSDSGTLHLEALTVSYLLLARFGIIFVDVVFQVRPHLDQVWNATRVISMPVSDKLHEVSVIIGDIHCLHVLLTYHVLDSDTSLGKGGSQQRGVFRLAT